MPSSLVWQSQYTLYIPRSRGALIISGLYYGILKDLGRHTIKQQSAISIYVRKMVFKGFSTRVPNEAEQKTRQNLDTLRKLGNLCTNKLLDYGRYVHGLKSNEIYWQWELNLYWSMYLEFLGFWVSEVEPQTLFCYRLQELCVWQSQNTMSAFHTGSDRSSCLRLVPISITGHTMVHDNTAW